MWPDSSRLICQLKITADRPQQSWRLVNPCELALDLKFRERWLEACLDLEVIDLTWLAGQRLDTWLAIVWLDTWLGSVWLDTWLASAWHANSTATTQCDEEQEEHVQCFIGCWQIVSWLLVGMIVVTDINHSQECRILVADYLLHAYKDEQHFLPCYAISVRSFPKGDLADRPAESETRDWLNHSTICIVGASTTDYIVPSSNHEDGPGNVLSVS